MAGKDNKVAKPSEARLFFRVLGYRNRPSSSASDSDSGGEEGEQLGGGGGRGRRESVMESGETSGTKVKDASRGNDDVVTIRNEVKKLGYFLILCAMLLIVSLIVSCMRTRRFRSRDTVPRASVLPEPISYNVILWRNGFTLGDGVLRRFDDPQNAPFLEIINERLKESEPAVRRFPVHWNLIWRDEDCPVYAPFRDVGRILGSSSSSVPEPSIHSAGLSPTNHSTQGVSVDESKPSTSMEVILSDGTRLVARFNNHHTISDIRAFIDAARPRTSSTYQLLARRFPPMLLDDPMQTIEQAGLINSVVLQKFQP